MQCCIFNFKTILTSFFKIEFFIVLAWHAINYYFFSYGKTNKETVIYHEIEFYKSRLNQLEWKSKH